MTDVFDKEQRSEIMSRVKSSGNRSTEVKLIEFFRLNGIKGWRRKYEIFGKPDFVFLEKKVAIFLDGCFWHGHDCRNTRPEQNKEYWEKKRAKNMARDAEVTAHLEKLGWRVIRVWECELQRKNETVLLQKLADISI